MAVIRVHGHSCTSSAEFQHIMVFLEIENGKVQVWAGVACTLAVAFSGKASTYDLAT